MRIVRLCRTIEHQSAVVRALAVQLARAGTSIGANTHEAQAAQSRPDFISKNAIALKEAHETAYWLDVVSGAELVPSERIAPLRQECEELIAIISTITKHAREPRQ